MLKFIAKISIFVCLLSTINPAIADRVYNLYDVEILVADESSKTREHAFKQGLDEIFVRISGDSIVMEKLERPPPSRYIKQFSYEPVEKSIVNDNDEFLTHRIKIQYNGRGMEKYLRDKDIPVWGEYRSDLVVWLVVRDGSNEYVLKDNDQSVLKTSMDDAMTRRGVPDVWPVYDKADKKILRVSDIRGGFKEPVEKASQRYSKGPALTGSMIWNGKQWQSSWSLLMQGESRHWSLNDTDHGQLINRSIDQAADALGEAYAVHITNNNQQLASIWLDIQAVGTIENYRYVENYLAGLSAVEKVKPAKVASQNAVFEVLLRSDEEDFLGLIKNDAELTALDAAEIQALKKQVEAKQSVNSQSEIEQIGNKQAGNERAGNEQSGNEQIDKKPSDTSLVKESQPQATKENNLTGTEKGSITELNTEKMIAEKSDDVPKVENRQTHYYRLNNAR